MTGLAYIGKVLDIIKIPGAEKIESLDVVCGEGGRWRGCAQKGQFKVNDPCAIFLQDALLPDDPLKWPEFEFMKKYKYRVRMCKFLGTPSEVLIMPINEMLYDVGTDVTNYFGVTKYSKQIPLNMRGERKGNFPSFIPRTDEPNFQTVPELINAMYNQKVYITEKLDGTSCTMYFYKTHFGVCSRNWEKQNTEGCLYWQMAKKYKVAEKLRERYLYMSDLAIQGEIVGPGIQKNPLGLSEHTFCIFNVYDILQERYCPIEYVEQVSAMLQLPMVRLLERNKTFTITLSDELRNLAEGTYVSGKEREGIVVRTMVEQKINGLRASFKIINLNYKGN